MYLTEAILATQTLGDQMTLQQEMHIEIWDMSLVHVEKGHVLSLFANASL
jgi:hypothetical protein